MQSHLGAAVDAPNGSPGFCFFVFSNLSFLSLSIVTCVYVVIINVIIIFAFSSVQTLIYCVVYY